MAIDFKALIGIMYDKKQAQSELNRQIKSLQKNSKLALNLEVTDKEAKKAIQDSTKMWSNYRSEAIKSISAPNTELKKMAQFYKNQERDIQSQISAQKKLTIATEQAYKANDSYNNKVISNQKSLYVATEQAYKTNNKLNDSISITKTKADAAQKSFSNYVKTLNLKTQKEFANDISNLNRKFEEVKQTGNSDLFRKVNASAQQIKATIKDAGGEIKSFGNILKDDITKFFQWTLSATALMGAINTVKNTISTVTELDASLVDLQMATGLNNQEAGKLLSTYIELGQELGATGTEVSSAASDYLRQGKSVAETNALIKDSIMLSKLGNIQAADATKFLTSAMKGYKVEALDVIDIVDKLSAVDLVSATDAGGLAEGMSQVANNARIAGIEMNKLLGYLAVIGETTGESMSSVGTGLNAIFSRMGNIKLSRLKDYQNNGEDLSNVETVLRGVGIQLRDSQDSFKDFGVVLDEVSGKWNSYSDVNKRAIASAMAGVNHMEQFLVLMENYGTALSYSATASNSAGTAMKKFENHEESVAGKTKTLQANLQELAMDTLDSQVIKSFLDFSNVLVNVVDDVGVFNLALIATAGIIGGKGLLILFPKLAMEIGGVATSFGLSATAAGTLGATLSTMLPVIGGLLAITAVVKAFDYFNVTLEEQRDKSDALISKYKETESELSSLQDELKTTGERIDELNEKDTLTIVEAEELSKLQTTNLELQKRIDLLSEQSTLLNQKSFDELKNTYEKDFGDIREYGYTENMDTYIAKDESKYVNELVSEYEDLQKIKDKNSKQDERAKEIYSLLVDEAVKLQTEYIDKAAELGISDETVEGWKSFRDELYNLIHVSETVEESVAETQQIISYSIASLSESFDKIEESISDFTSDLQTLDSTIASVSDDESLNASEVLKLIQKYPELANKIKETSDGYTIEKEALELVRKKQVETQSISIKAEISKTETAIQAIKDRIIAYEAEWIELEKLGQKQQEIANQKNNPANLPINLYGANPLSPNLNKWKEDASTAVNDLTTSEAQLESLRKQLDLLFTGDFTSGSSSSSSSRKSDKKDPQWLIDYNTTKANLDHLLAMDKISQSKYYDELSILNEEGFGKHKKDYLEQYRKNVEDIYKGRKQIDEENTKAYQDKVEGWIGNYKNRFESGQITEEQYYTWSNAVNEKYYKGKEEYLDVYKQHEQEYYEWSKKEFSDLLSNQSEQFETEISNREEKLKTLQGDLDNRDSAISAVNNYYSDEIEDLNNAIKVTEKYYNVQKANIQETIDQKKKVNEETNKQLELQQSLYEQQRALTQANKAVMKNGKIEYEVDKDAIRKAQSDVENKKNEIEIANLENSIDSLDKLEKAAVDNYNTQIEKLESLQKAFNDVFDGIEKLALEQYAVKFFGEDWKDEASKGKLKNMDEFVLKYQATKDAIKTTEDEIKDYELKIEEVNKVKKAWEEQGSTSVNAIKNTTKALEASNIADKELLKTKLEQFSAFATEYNALVSGLKTPNTEVTIDTKVTTPQVIGGVISGLIKGLPTRHSGVLAGAVGKEDKTSATDAFVALAKKPLKPNEALVTMLKGEYGILPPQMNNVLTNIKSGLTAFTPISQSQPITVSIGDIVLQGIDNTDSLGNEIVTRLGSVLTQKLNKR